DPVPDFEDHHFLFPGLVEFEGCGDGVRSLLVVIEHEMSADGADLGRIFHAESPARHVHLMDALVSHVAIAVLPEPVPVVMESIAREFMLGRGAEPEIVIHALWNRLDRLAANRVAPLEAKAARHVDVADYARPQLLDR